MTLNVIKFSQFSVGSLANSTNIIVGVTAATSGTNFRLPYINSWSTGGRPATPATGVLGYNTSLSQYEYWNGAAWVQFASGGSGTVNVGATNELAYYQSNGTAVAGLMGANNGVLITSSGGAPSWLANGTTGQALIATTGSPPSWGDAPGSPYSNVVISSSGSGLYSTSSGTPAAIPNLVVTITTLGGPVELSLQSTSAANMSQFNGSGGTLILSYYRDSTQLNNEGVSALVPVSSFRYIDQPPPGTYTYTVKAYVNAGTGYAVYASLVAIEI